MRTRAYVVQIFSLPTTIQDPKPPLRSFTTDFCAGTRCNHNTVVTPRAPPTRIFQSAPQDDKKEL